MRVLVTGAAGFIGRHVVERLLAEGHEVAAYDLLHPGAHAGPPEQLPGGAEWTLGADVRDRAALAAAAHGVDAACHLAAMVGLGTDFADAGDYVAHNCAGTAELLSFLHARGFTGRIVLASSMVVYGEGGYRCAEHGSVAVRPRLADDLARGRFEPRCPACGGNVVPAPVGEDAPADPRNVYAATKLHQEHLVGAYVREHAGASAACLRYHNVYGPWMPRDTPYAGVASIFRSALARGEAPAVYEDGGQLRDFVHVRDVARATALALAAPIDTARAFNVCSGRPRSVLEMAEELTRAAGGPEPRVTGAFRLGDVRHVFAAPERAAAELGFEAAEDFAAGIAEFADAPLRDPAGSVAGR